MKKRSTKALYHAGDLVVKRSDATNRHAQTYAVQHNQQEHEQYITAQRDNHDWLFYEQDIVPFGSETCSTK